MQTELNQIVYDLCEDIWSKAKPKDNEIINADVTKSILKIIRKRLQKDRESLKIFRERFNIVLEREWILFTKQLTFIKIFEILTWEKIGRKSAPVFRTDSEAITIFWNEWWWREEFERLFNARSLRRVAMDKSVALFNGQKSHVFGFRIPQKIYTTICTQCLKKEQKKKRWRISR